MESALSMPICNFCDENSYVLRRWPMNSRVLVSRLAHGGFKANRYISLFTAHLKVPCWQATLYLVLLANDVGFTLDLYRWNSIKHQSRRSFFIVTRINNTFVNLIVNSITLINAVHIRQWIKALWFVCTVHWIINN